MIFRCSICGQQCHSFSNLCTHLGIWHASGVNLTCGIDGCRQTFARSSALRAHGYRRHALVIRGGVNRVTPTDPGEQIICESTEPNQHEIGETTPREITVQNPGENIESGRCNTNKSAQFEATASTSRHNILLDLEADIDCEPVVYQNKEHRVKALQGRGEQTLLGLHRITSGALTDLFLKIRETNSLPDSTTRNIFAELSMIFLGFFSGLNEVGAIAPTHDDILNEDYVFKLFDSVSSEYRISEHVKNHEYYVPPVEHKLRDNLTMQYISVSETLKSLFANDELFAELVNYLGSPSSNTILSDFKDGTYNHTVCEDVDCDFVLPLVFYTDEFEVCNPIGSARIKHKIAAVYFTLACLPPMLRSKRKYIFLSALIPDRARKDLGYSAVLKPVIEELSKIYRDPIILKNGKTICAKLVAFCGDNLSAHALGGFQGSFATGHICRFCHCCYGDISNVFMECECELRTLASIQTDIDVITADGGSSRGLKSQSILFELRYSSFDLVSLLLPDCLHDFLEGVVPKVISVVLRTLRSSKVVKLTEVNRLVLAFKYRLGGSGLNPFNLEITSQNLMEEKFKGTASQKWALLVHLPLILKSTDVSIEQEAWVLMLKCREIGEIILSDSIPKCKLEFLAILINEHHTLFRKLAPTSLTPKFHYLIHYPRIIAQYGPPKRYWTMRFEAKHQYFKDLARKCKNFKNLPLTLAKRCQTLQAVVYSSAMSINHMDIAAGPGETFPVSDLEDHIVEPLKDVSGLGYFEDDIVYSSSWIDINGIKYRKGCMLITGIVQEEIPLFVRVDHIVSIRSKWYLGGPEIIPSRFDERTWSYVCEQADDQQIWFQDASALFCRSPVLCYKIGGLSHILLVSLPS